MVAPFLGGHWSVVVPPVVSASPMRHWADATLAPGLYRPETLLQPSKNLKKEKNLNEKMFTVYYDVIRIPGRKMVENSLRRGDSVRVKL